MVSDKIATNKVYSERLLQTFDLDLPKFMHMQEDDRAVFKVVPSVRLQVDHFAILGAECPYDHGSGSSYYGCLVVSLLMEFVKVRVTES